MSRKEAEEMTFNNSALIFEFAKKLSIKPNAFSEPQSIAGLMSQSLNLGTGFQRYRKGSLTSGWTFSSEGHSHDYGKGLQHAVPNYI